MKKCFAVAISILIILMSCSEHKKVEKVLTWEDSVDMALKGYVYLNYPDSSDFLIRNRKVAYRNDTLCIVFVDAITTLEDNTLGPVEMEFSMWKKKDGWKYTTMPYYGKNGIYPIATKYDNEKANRMLSISYSWASPKDIKFLSSFN